MEMKTVLKVDQINYQIKNSKILNNISFSLNTGEVLGLIGPNGSGKSTLLKILSKIIDRQYSGFISCDDSSISDVNMETWASQVTYVGHDFFSDFPLTVYDVVDLASHLNFKKLSQFDQKKIKNFIFEILSELKCDHLSNKNLFELSSGERQLVALARARAQGAKTLLLDEVTSFLDLDHQSLMVGHFKSWCKQGNSIVMVSHDINFTLLCADKVLLINRGEQIGFGSVEETINEVNLKKLYPKNKLKIDYHPVRNSKYIYF